MDEGHTFLRIISPPVLFELHPKQFEGGPPKAIYGRGKKAHAITISVESIRDLPAHVLAKSSKIA